MGKEISESDEGYIRGGNSAALKQLLLIGLSSKDLVTKEYLKKLINSLANNENKLQKLSQKEINLLESILNLKNVDLFSSPSSLNSDTKQALNELTKMLNVPRPQLENLINLTFVTNSDRICQAIFDIAPSQDAAYIARSQ